MIEWWKFWRNLSKFCEKLGIFVMFIAVNVGVLYNKLIGVAIGGVSMIFLGLAVLFRWLSR